MVEYQAYTPLQLIYNSLCSGHPMNDILQLFNILLQVKQCRLTCAKELKHTGTQRLTLIIFYQLSIQL